MIDKVCATKTRECALNAVSELSQVLNVSLNRCTAQEYEQIKKGVGLSIGTIQCELLNIIYATYPELDDLNVPSTRSISEMDML